MVKIFLGKNFFDSKMSKSTIFEHLCSRSKRSFKAIEAFKNLKQKNVLNLGSLLSALDPERPMIAQDFHYEMLLTIEL